jgi:hypothetical protein
VRFSPGQRVSVAARPHPGHHRTPGYLKGKTGTIERVHGAFPNPETRAYGGDGLPEKTLYLVAFDGGPGHKIYGDIFEHWLEETE